MACGVTKRYGHTTVLDGIDLTITAGEWVGLIGPSGSGKTTMLAILGGLLDPDTGSVGVEPAVDGHADVGRHVAWILQTTNILGGRSVIDNAALGALADGASETEAAERAVAALVRVGLGHTLDHKAKTLSGGERQRLAVARALSSSRRFVLADEPTGQLDRATSETVIAQMRQGLVGVGVLLATHDHLVRQYCDRVVVLADGALTSFDEP